MLEFQAEFDIRWVWFRRLAAYDLRLADLDDKRWKGAVQGPNAAYASTRVKTILLAEAIASSPYDLLDAMEVPYHRRRGPAGDPKTGGRQRPAAGAPGAAATCAPVGPEGVCAFARSLAGQAAHPTGFTLLLNEYDREAARCPDAALTVLETVLYSGYRYMAPSDFWRALVPRERAICDLAPRAEPALRLRCAAQVACALSEHGDGGLAGQLFDDLEDARLLDPGRVDEFWYQPQLIRSRAIYLWKHAGEPHRSLRQLEDALAWSSHGNRRAIATIQCLAHARKERFDHAWEAIEPFYELDCRTLAGSLAAGRPTDGDLGHVFSGVLRGSLARVLAGRKYRPGELDHELKMMKWCVDRYGTIEHEVAPLVGPSRRLDAVPDLRSFGRGCDTRPYPPHLLTLLGRLMVTMAASTG